MSRASHIVLVALVVLACKRDGETATPATGNGASAAPNDIPPAEAKLEPVPDAIPLGAKMWRRFGKGEWTAQSFFVPDPKNKSVTIILDMAGGGKAVSDWFELVVEPQGLELVEGEARMDARVPPDRQRRATWKLTVAQPGIGKIRFVTFKDGEEKGSVTACLSFADAAIYRCTESQAAEPPAPDTTHRGTYCCATSNNGAGEKCEPIGNVVEAIDACMKAKKHTLTCDAGVSCTGDTCRCR